jgi:hypothetical protein
MCGIVLKAHHHRLHFQAQAETGFDGGGDFVG